MIIRHTECGFMKDWAPLDNLQLKFVAGWKKIHKRSLKSTLSDDGGANNDCDEDRLFGNT